MADSIGTVNNQSSTQPNGHNSHSNTTESLWRGTDYGKWFVADSCTSLSSSIQGFAMPLIGADRHGLTGTGDAAGFNHDHDIVGIAAARWRGTR